MKKIVTNEYINRHENLIIFGATGSGKSYIACALGVEACNATLKVMYVRLPDLLAELDLATVQENYRKRINQYIKCNLLILDDYSLVIAPVVAELCTTSVALSAPPNSYQNNSQS